MMRMEKVEGQNGRSGMESLGLYQSVPAENAGYHWPTCIPFLPKKTLALSINSLKLSGLDLLKHTIAPHHSWH